MAAKSNDAIWKVRDAAKYRGRYGHTRGLFLLVDMFKIPWKVTLAASILRRCVGDLYMHTWKQHPGCADIILSKILVINFQETTFVHIFLAFFLFGFISAFVTQSDKFNHII